jgi:2,3-bisphosphoglycerate-independent phosphoglycerate mutase
MITTSTSTPIHLPMPVEVKNRVCLMYVYILSFFFFSDHLLSVHDGWGVATDPGLEGNAIEAGDTTNMDTIAENHSYRTLAAHGTAVGLSEGLMGNSEVGYALTGPNCTTASYSIFFTPIDI